MKNTILLLLSVIVLSVSSGATANAECKRIVSLAASITNNLYLLGVQDRIVGRTQYCSIADQDNIPIVADAVNVNIEKIANLKPDIVIASGLTHPRIISAIQKMGIKTIHWHQPKNFDDICSQFRELGQLCGKEDAAEHHIRQSRERLKGIEKTTDAKKIDIFMEQGCNPLFTVLPGSFMNDYITRLGGINICSEFKTGMVSREYILTRNPEVIIIISMGKELGKEEQKKWETFKSLKAARNKKIFVVEADKICVPTPVTFVNALDNLVKQIYQ